MDLTVYGKGYRLQCDRPGAECRAVRATVFVGEKGVAVQSIYE